MMICSRWPIRIALAAMSVYAGLLDPELVPFSGSFAAHAQVPDAEKDAFDAAKELGTVEAWDAFLSNYPSGFRADLARAYVKKLAEPPAAVAPAVAPPGPAAVPGPAQGFDYPAVAGSWGGIVRSGPGQGYGRVASLREGEEVTLMAPPIPVSPGDYPWFKIAFRDGGIGYMWGGLLCSTGAERPDLFKLCTWTPYRDVSGGTPPREKRAAPRSSGSGKPSWCRSPGNEVERAICNNADILSLDSVLNVAYRRAKFDSPNQVDGIVGEQRRWLERRNMCGYDPECIRGRYNEQISFLESFFGN